MPSLFKGEVDKRTFVAGRVHEPIAHVVLFRDECFEFTAKNATP